MSKTIRIGKITLTHEGDWIEGKSYDQLSLVRHGNTTYISKKFVPANISLEDGDYWDNIIDVTKESVEAALGYTPADETAVETEATARTEADEALNKAITDAITALQQAIALKQDALTDEQKQAIADLHEDAVKDVTLNGDTLVENGVAKLYKANQNRAGLVAIDPYYNGISVDSDGYLYVSNASNSYVTKRVKKGDYGYGSITPANLDYAVKAALTDGVGASYTEAEQIAGCDRLGIIHPAKEWKLVGSITGNADDRGNIDSGCTVDLTGCTEMTIVFKTTGTNDTNLLVNGINLIHYAARSSQYGGFYQWKDTAFGIIETARHLQAGNSTSGANGGYAYAYWSLDATSPATQISVFKTFKFTYPAVVTSCDLKIYGR